MDTPPLTFSLYREECVKRNSWLAEHDKTCVYASPLKQGASGGRLTYSFSPNGLGTVVQVKCACGAECDVTDYNW